ncbi:hypothetical protein [Arthrobacter sp. Soil762]|uniref:hypothetical protein n=1 Tax=Arthrobacter sp. Soil762 TaxID=1736401 RepID=UPI0006F90ADE|nr:hypothetical protein [Arthrobacter sp. Soil762]KRE72090.1 hypothetical protein ASG77_09290 [Arthrobacter sp. Soil762]
MRKMTKKNKVLAAAGAMALVAGGGGAAYAYWTTLGSGSGEATNSEGKGKVDLTAHFAGGLAPGNTVDVVYKADNGTTSSTRVGELTANVTTSDDLCLSDWFHVSALTDDALVAATSTGTTVGSGVLEFFDLPDVDQEACKSAVITVNVTSV